MRVSKVKVKVNSTETMVLMHRTSKKGNLVFEKQVNTECADCQVNKEFADCQVNTECTDCIIKELKLDSFALSTLNQTIIKKSDIYIPGSKKGDKQYKKRLETNYKEVRTFVQSYIDIALGVSNAIIRFPKSKKPDWVVDLFIHRKFKANTTSVGFDLKYCIVQSIAKKDISYMQPYGDWVKQYKELKSARLIHSINENRICIDDSNLSRRQQLLLKLEEYYLKDGNLREFSESIDFAPIYEILMSGIDIDAFSKEVAKEKPKPFEYHLLLKRNLQQYQQTLFGKNVADSERNKKDDKLVIHFGELTKYLEHYFPIKKSGRRNTPDDITYYLKADTIKNTITRQLENAVRANLLRKGKYQHHELDTTASSETLTDIKRREAFVMNLIDACAFAANNIRNMLDNTLKEDVLLAKNTTVHNPYLFDLYFQHALPDGESRDEAILALIGSVSAIRHNVVHYNRNAFNELFGITNYKVKKSGATLRLEYCNSVFAGYYQEEIAALSTNLAKQLAMAGVSTWFDRSGLQQLLQKHQLRLHKALVPFTPGFKNVYAQGYKYQCKTEDYTLNLHTYSRELVAEDKVTPTNTDKVTSAYYFLLKLIYNHIFLPAFTDEGDDRLMRKAILDVKLYNQKFNKKKAEEDAKKRDRSINEGKLRNTGFNTMPELESGMKAKDYLKQLHSNTTIEANKKEGTDKEKVNNFDRFLKQVFIKGFDTFLQAPEFHFLKHPLAEVTDEDVMVLENPILHSLDCTRNEEVAFYVFCKLLSPGHLSTLRNELLKLEQSYLNDNRNDEFELYYLYEVIELCLLSSDNLLYNDRANQMPEALNDTIKTGMNHFISKGSQFTDFDSLYLKNDELIEIHKNMVLTIKSGTINLLAKVVDTSDSLRISTDQYNAWKDFRTNEERVLEGKPVVKSKIVWQIEEKQQLHKQWVEDKKILYSTDFVNRYEYLCAETDRYNWLDNKLHFVHLIRLQSLLIELLSRMAGFVNLIDRDFLQLDHNRAEDPYYLKQFVNLQKIDSALDKGSKIKDISEIKYRIGIKGRKEDKPTEQDRVQLHACVKVKRAYFNRFFGLKDKAAEDKFYNTRNHVAHFNYLTLMDNVSGKDVLYSIPELISNLREMLSYDRKLKNVVITAIKDIFFKHGLNVCFSFDKAKHSIVSMEVQSASIYHLGTKEPNPRSKNKQVCIKTARHDEEFVLLCNKLLELKKMGKIQSAD